MSSNPLAYADLSALSDTEYTGLDDTAIGFSGGSADQVPWAGSPIVMGGQDSNEFMWSTPDFIDSENPTAAQWLTGISEPPFASARNSTPYPDVQPTGPSTWAAFSALSKFGTSVASLFGSHPQTIQPARYPVNGQLPTGAPVLGGLTGTNTLLVVIVAGALIILLLRTKEA